MSALRVGTRIRQLRCDGAIHFGRVVERREVDGLDLLWIGIHFDGDPEEEIGWFEPRDLRGAGIEPGEPLPFRFPTSAADLAEAGLCPRCIDVAKGSRP